MNELHTLTAHEVAQVLKKSVSWLFDNLDMKGGEKTWSI